MLPRFVDGSAEELRALPLSDASDAKAGAEAGPLGCTRSGATGSAESKLGAHLIQLSPGSDAWGWELTPDAVMNGTLAEHIEDAVPVLGQYGHLLAVRAFAGLTDRAEDAADPVLAAFQRFSPVPVLSLESTRFHPLRPQSLCSKP